MKDELDLDGVNAALRKYFQEVERPLTTEEQIERHRKANCLWWRAGEGPRVAGAWRVKPSEVLVDHEE